MPDGGVTTRLPANLDIEHARLPANYEAAKVALAECSRVDECQDWADKMAALASYARQLNDEILLAYCRRIQARAIDRVGQVLEEIPAGQGARDGERDKGDLTPLTRTEAAAEAGLTLHQQRTAMRVHAVPRDQFETLVESANPPTVTALANIGRRERAPIIDHLAGRDPGDFQQATKLWGGLRGFVREVMPVDLAAAARGLAQQEAQDVRQNLAAVRQWLVLAEEAVGSADA